MPKLRQQLEKKLEHAQVAELKEQGSADLEAKVAEVREIVDQNAQAVADLSSKAEAYDERFEETEKALGAVDEEGQGGEGGA